MNNFSDNELLAMIEFVGMASSIDRGVTRCFKHRERSHDVDASTLKRKLKEELNRRKNDG